MKRRIKLICVSMFFGTACVVEHVPEQALETVISTHEKAEDKTESEETAEPIKTIDIWDVEPVFEYDDIDTSFASHWHFGNDDYLNYALIYSMDDPYNSAGSVAFTGSFEKGGVFVYKHGHLGVMDGNGNITHDPQYDQYNDWTSMLINSSAVMACEVQYDYSVGTCMDGWGVGGSYRHYGSLTKDAMIMDNFNNQLISVFDLHADAVGAGLIDENECFIYDAQKWDDDSSNLIVGYVAVGKNSYKQLTEGFIKKLVSFSDDIVLLAYEDSSGKRSDYEFINTDGTVLSAGYEEAYGFFEGYAPVRKDGKWGYIDKTGQCVTEYVFDKATPVCNGKAWVIYHGRTGKLNLIDMIENDVSFNEVNLNVNDYPVKDPTKWIEINVNSINVRNKPSTSGDKIASVGYGDIIPYISKQEQEGYIWYQLNSDRWIADQNGEWIIEK